LADLADAAEALSVAVPASLHYRVVMALLCRGRHVLVEKPLASTVAEAREMVAAAETRGLVLAVGHVERFNPVLSLLADADTPPAYIEAQRLMPFPPYRPAQGRRGCDVSVVLDLMIHDIDLALALIPFPVNAIDALACPLLGEREDFAVARLHFANGSRVQLTASRVHPEARRTWLVHAGKRQYHLDFIRCTGTLAEAGPEGVTLTQPATPAANALEEELRDFCCCVRPALAGAQPGTPRIPGSQALAALAVAERVLDACRDRPTGTPCAEERLG
jgi:predicted dehydrogenase